MKIDRLLGILSLLLRQEQVTAPALAARFEVSRRTILRDVDDLCRAGFPLVTVQGAAAASPWPPAGGWTAPASRRRSWRTCWRASGDLAA